MRNNNHTHTSYGKIVAVEELAKWSLLMTSWRGGYALDQPATIAGWSLSARRGCRAR